MPQTMKGNNSTDLEILLFVSDFIYVILCNDTMGSSLELQCRCCMDFTRVNAGPDDVYEDPDKTAATTAPGKFKLTKCPAYDNVATTSSTLQPAHSTTEPQLQTSYII